MEEETFTKHLIRRGLSSKYTNNVFIDRFEEIVTFPLWNCTGQFLGYQKYDWKADKLRNNDNKGKYYTYRRKDWLTFWGLDLIDLSCKEPLYIVEGVWDAVSVNNAGFKCIAVLSNHPKQLKNLLNCLPCKTVALCDGDDAGKMLSKVTDECISLPKKVDCNDMSTDEIKILLK